MRPGSLSFGNMALNMPCLPWRKPSSTLLGTCLCKTGTLKVWLQFTDLLTKCWIFLSTDWGTWIYSTADKIGIYNLICRRDRSWLNYSSLVKNIWPSHKLWSRIHPASCLCRQGLTSVGLRLPHPFDDPWACRVCGRGPGWLLYLFCSSVLRAYLKVCTG